jgi:hypothetical protein
LPEKEAAMTNKVSDLAVQDLDELATTIRAALEAARQARSNALGYALRAGDALNAAQERVSSGWKQWLRANCFLSLSTAQLYQQLARHRSEIEAKIEQVGELSLRAARRLIAKSDTKKKKNKSTSFDALAWWLGAPIEARTHFLDGVGMLSLLAALSPALRAQLGQRVVGQRAAKTSKLADTLTSALRTALSLQTKAPADQAAIGVANALNGILNKLASEGLDLHDVEIIISAAMKRAA